MALTRRQILNIVVDVIQDVNIDAMMAEEEDEIADIVLDRLAEEAPELVEDEEEPETEDAES
jgi:hypothetical protein